MTYESSGNTSEGHHYQDEEEEEEEDEVIGEVSSEKTQSVQDILNSSSVETITHHNGSDNMYMANKILKLQCMYDPHNHKSGHVVVSDIFRDCFLFVNGDTKPSRAEIQRLVMIHGGHFDAYKTSRTTHFVCDHFPNTKITELSKNHPRIKIKYVTVAWFVESINAGKRLSEAHYTPLGIHSGQKKLDFGNKTKNDCVDDGGDEGEREGYGGNRDWLGEDVAGSSHCDSVLPSTAQTGENAYKSKKRTAADPNYMKQFYGASRLHFIGTWRSRLPDLIDELDEERSRASDSKPFEYDVNQFAEKGCNSTRGIIHVDMDCFFVSVLLRASPQLSDKPVAVAHSSSAGSSEVSSCNYPARKFGLKAGMFMKTAKSLCPDLVVMKYDFAQYEEVSKQLYKICLNFSPTVEPVSVDELYVECPAGHNVRAAAEFLRGEIFRQTGCTASAGVGKNMLLARLGTAKAKPNGLFIVPSAESSTLPQTLSPTPTMQFMATIPLKSLPGVGRKIFKKLLSYSTSSKTSTLLPVEEEEEEEEEDDGEQSSRNLKSSEKNENNVQLSSTSTFELCQDLWPIPLSTLTTLLGGPTIAKSLYESCRGRDQRKMKSMKDIGDNRKSVGAEVNYGHRYATDNKGTAMEKAESFLRNLCGEVTRRLEEARMCGFCVTVKLMKRRASASVNTTKYLGHGACDNMSKSQTLTKAVGKKHSSDSALLEREALTLFRAMVSLEGKANTFPPEDIRGMGVQVTRLEKLQDVAKKGIEAEGLSNPIGILFSSAAATSNSTGNSKPDSDVAPAYLGSNLVKRDFVLPPASQIDYSVLAELEESILNSDDALNTDEKYTDKSRKRNIGKLYLGFRNQIGAQEESLTCSQIDFINNIPPDLHEEVIQQMPLRKKQGCDVSSKVASNESEVHFKLNTSRISGSCLPLNEEIDVAAPVDLPLAPSVILRHKVMSVSELRRVLKEWMREEIRYPSNENDDLYYSDCGNNASVADLSLSRKEALISYAIWLVFSNQLDKARGLVKLLESLQVEQKKMWSTVTKDVVDCVQLSCQEKYGCKVLL